ncbi:FAD-dependent oxidoreductase [Phytomonospora endophytica]|uniref:Assimilatory nitrate reductase electron transfer subunit n=1 Tax=Phytomonospora endophytica TaxID=714109 RepID=A0A841FDT2_9ACTN|nr:FAD-dependent oxidoreductase [Phytomonospora endophytica]MBB6033173.1 assimilatory nitrate reductase electron transfer subunit [Phytomonospora endophytica]GIG65400.1 FAD/NAD(P)-binding oxidoreductase [Phytomonospora endophytica]
MKVVIAGYGMAGARLARELGRHGVQVTVLGAETEPAYNRVLLPGLLAGTHAEEDLRLPAPPAHVELRLGEPVTTIDREAKRVNGIAYDALVLATGAEAALPPIPGLDRHSPRATVFRSLADCRAILDATDGPGVPRRRRALVLGGGLLGLEAARGLAGRGLDVTVVHAAGHLMERQLDTVAGDLLARTLSGLGVTVLTNVDVKAVEETTEGVRLRFGDGGHADGDLLVVSCGVRPRTALAEAAGLAVGRGVVIDERCATGDPDIYAIGDCAEFEGRNLGLVAPAWEQAEVVARNLTGTPAVYRGVRPVTRLKAGGIDLAAMGSLDGEEVVSFADPARGTYVRLVIDADRLAGAVLLGDNPTTGQVTQLFDHDDPVPADRRSLLLGRAFGEPPAAATPAAQPDDAVVCRCNTVHKGTLVRAYAKGSRTPAELSRATLAATGCGGCAGDVAAICGWLRETAKAPELTEVAA